MTFSEDSASAAAPFQGDQSIFDQPDFMLSAPATTERVVDTQSGFLLVVKRLGERLALSCRRRVGTPPTSNILLTPDESLKLSKILGSYTCGLDDSSESKTAGLLQARANTRGRRRFAFMTNAKNSERGGFFGNLARKPAIIAGACVLAGVIMVGSFVVGKNCIANNSSISMDASPLTPKNIEHFSRNFVSEMLDFNPDTYKSSQIQAMSYMSAELLEKYWKETNFPLTKRQLKSLPQGTTLMISKIVQEKTGDASVAVDIFGDLMKSESKMSNPVHIKLKLALNAEGAIQVLAQEDITATSTIVGQ